MLAGLGLIGLPVICVLVWVGALADQRIASFVVSDSVRATEAFYATSAGVAGTLIIAVTVAIGRIAREVSDAGAEVARRFVVASVFSLVSFGFVAWSLAEALSALTDCRPVGPSQRCGDESQFVRVAAGLILGVAALVVEVIIVLSPVAGRLAKVLERDQGAKSHTAAAPKDADPSATR